MSNDEMLRGLYTVLRDKEAQESGELGENLRARAVTAQEKLDVVLDEGREYMISRDGGFGHDDGEFNWTPYPLHAYFIDTIKPKIANRFPKWYAHGSGTGKVWEDRKMAYGALADKLWKKYDIKNLLNYAIDDAIIYGFAAAEIDLDLEQGTPRVLMHKSKDILVDPDSSRTEDSLRWIGIKYMMTREEAEEKWPDQDWDNITGQDDEDSVGSPRRWDIKEMSMRGMAHKTEKLSFIRFYVRGDSPNRDDASIKSASGRTDRGNKNEVITILDDDGQPHVVERKDWPLVLPLGSFPVEFLRFTFHGDSFLQPSVLRKGHALQEQASWALTYMNTTLRYSAQRKVIVNTEYFDDFELEKLESPTDFERIDVTDDSAFNAIKILNFIEQSNPALFSSLHTNAEVYKFTMGLNEIIMENKSHTTASGNALVDEQSTLRVSIFIDAVEKFSTNITTKLLMAALWTMDAEEVVEEIGEENLPGQWVVENGSSVGYDSEAWPEDLKPKDIRRWANVSVEQGSMRHVSGEGEQKKLMAFVDHVNGQVAALQSVLEPQGKTINGEALAKFMFGVIERFAESSEIRNVSELTPRIEEFIIKLPPPPMPEGAPGGPPQPQI